MKAKTILREWVSYINQLTAIGKMEPVAEGEALAILYGTDEVKFNAANKTIKLPGLERIAVDGDTSQLHFDWVALYRENDEFVVAFGVGSPFDTDALKTLPSKNGIVLAVPNGAAEGCIHV